MLGLYFWAFGSYLARTGGTMAKRTTTPAPAAGARSVRSSKYSVMGQTPTVNYSPTDELGETGLRHSGGFILDEWHRPLQGRRGVAAFREMADNSPIVGAWDLLLKSLLQLVDWHAEPADETPQALEAAEFLKECMGDMSMTWADTMAEIASMGVFGWAMFEKVYKIRGGRSDDRTRRSRYDDGKIGLRKIEIRAQESLDRWEIDQDGSIRGMWQYPQGPIGSSGGAIFLPIEKCVLFRTERNKNNPEGRSLLRNAWKSHYFAKRLQGIEAIGAERDAVGVPVMEVPPVMLSANATAEQKDALNEIYLMLQQLRRNEQEAIVTPSETMEDGSPSGYKLRLLQSGGSRQLDLNAMIERYEKRIAQSLAVQFIFLGMDKAGSFALSSDMTNLFAQAAGALLGNIQETFQRFVVDELMELNGYAPELTPQWRHGDLESQDIKKLSEAIKAFMDAGAITADDSLEARIRELMSLPPREDGDLEDDTEVIVSDEPIELELSDEVDE